MRTLQATLLLVLLALTACATSPGRIEEVDSGHARALHEQGEFRLAALEYERLADDHRGARDALLLAAAESLREEGDFAGVAAIAARIRPERLSASQLIRLDLLEAEAAIDAGDGERALSLATLPDGITDHATQVRAREIRARALAAAGRPIESVRERLALAAELDEQERASNEGDLVATLGAVEVPLLQSELARLEPGDPLRPWLERALRSKGSVPARIFVRPTREVGTLLPGERPDAWQREGYSAAAGRIALLLPLSGNLGSAGRAVRDGFFAAYFADESARPAVRLFDTGETTDGVVAAYQRAVQDGARRVVGPLAREQVAALFSEVAVTAPVLALNHPDDNEPPPAGSQLFGLLPDEEAAYAAERALERGYRTAAVFSGDEDWSSRAALAFRAQFEAKGGVVAGDARLRGEGAAYADAIARAVGGGVDVVFVTARPTQARQLVPQLRARGMTATPILATSHVYGGTPNRGLDRDLDGVEFCDAPWLFGLAPGLPARERIARDLPAAGSAARLFAFGMDAYRLLPYLDWLGANPEAYLPGASGQLSIDGFGRVRRTLAWLRFSDGVPRSADGALSSDGGGTP
ncbi:MAG TPA: penicillin-binding protein activator [Candidatus Saccharimonadia bacterium]|nr:penicillin-binding protein activator [Candidatus Saccharimonadia bacterium]